ncbi:hypothetical protein HOLleu_02975 [Holothuria leucospilota]|uniref:Uncharacterized protein n=1 Tax=Holothuria leucospilota TaxID=206669 RepID=A0A9Q1CQ97_HOLLE|nr:hypothetical protein HOLleu_02975 [Holothuria leucospilota]
MLSQNDCRVKAELIWAMNVAVHNYSFASCDNNADIFQAMFPDSAIAKHYAMRSSKLSYILTHALGPYFLRQLVKEIEGKYFTIHFDETVTAQMKKQMDVLVRFFSSRTSTVQVRFLKSVLFGHAFAEQVNDELVNLLLELKLPVKHVLSLSADGPYANKSIKQKMEAGGKGHVNVGFCNLHVVHNSFRKGLCIGLFYFLKKLAAR